jgi:protein-tyrosine-phosphatase
MAERNVLFVGVDDTSRAVMAEAMFNSDPPEGWHATSVVTEPAAAENPRTERMLLEIGLHRPEHAPERLTGQMVAESGTIVTMAGRDSQNCPPELKGEEVRDWAIADPSPLDDDGFRRVRTALRTNVRGLRQELILRDRRKASVASTLSKEREASGSS